MNRMAANLRRVLSVGLAAFGAWQLHRAGIVSEETLASVPWPLIVGALALIASLLGIAPDLARPLAAYLGDLAGRLFFPEARFSRPPLSYRLAEFYTREGRIGEAVEQYEGIIRHYPGERRAYSELITLARLQGDEKTASRYVRLAARRFPSRGRRKHR